MNRISKVSRRGFLESVLSSGALILGAQVVSFSKLEAADADNAAWNPNVYLGLQKDGSVIIVAHRSEMGTGIRTVLPMVVADELEADWTRVRVEQAIGDTKYGSQNTDGSCSIRDFHIAMQRAGASARLMLEQAAAAQWNVPADECKASMHQVVHTASGRRIAFGDLVAAASKLPVPDEKTLKFKDPSQYRYVGKDLPMIDLADVCTGRGAFGIDASMPGMLYASIERPPVFGGSVKSCDEAEALKVPGVEKVVKLPGLKPPYMFQQLGGVAVLARDTWTAAQARKKLKIDWEHGPNASWDSESYKKMLLDRARQPQKVVRNIGDVDAEFAKGGKTLEAAYYVPMLSHAPMEPPAAVAEFKDGKVVAWAATQNPQAVQDAVSAALGIDKKDVVCNVTLLGGGFGRKSKPDYVVEAALLSKAAGKPVKVTWTREDDIRFDYYHTVAGMYLKAAVDANGHPTAWLQRSVFPTIGAMFAKDANYAADFEMGMGWIDVPFALANHRAENGPAENPVRIGWMRSVSNIYHAFAVQSFVDELAAAANADRVEYLLKLIGEPRTVDPSADGAKYRADPRFPIETGRLRNVIEIAAKNSNWANRKPKAGRALGIAAHRSFLSYIAAVVDLEVDGKGKVKIHRVDYAVDAGTVIHPDRVKSQFEGAAVFGTSVAMLGEITARNGMIQESNFDRYPVARIDEAPRETHVHIVASKAPPAGVGEPGVPPIAPAICNAIFAATGKRIRELPVRKHKLV